MLLYTPGIDDCSLPLTVQLYIDDGDNCSAGNFAVNRHSLTQCPPTDLTCAAAYCPTNNEHSPVSHIHSGSDGFSYNLLAQFAVLLQQYLHQTSQMQQTIPPQPHQTSLTQIVPQRPIPGNPSPASNHGITSQLSSNCCQLLLTAHTPMQLYQFHLSSVSKSSRVSLIFVHYLVSAVMMVLSI